MSPVTGRARRTPNPNIVATVDGLGQRLRDVRLLRGVSQRGVGTLTNGALGKASVSRIESGARKDLTISTLLALCMTYDCDIKLCRNGKVTIHGTGLNGTGSEKV